VERNRSQEERTKGGGKGGKGRPTAVDNRPRGAAGRASSTGGSSRRSINCEYVNERMSEGDRRQLDATGTVIRGNGAFTFHVSDWAFVNGCVRDIYPDGGVYLFHPNPEAYSAVCLKVTGQTVTMSRAEIVEMFQEHGDIVGVHFPIEDQAWSHGYKYPGHIQFRTPEMAAAILEEVGATGFQVNDPASRVRYRTIRVNASRMELDIRYLLGVNRSLMGPRVGDLESIQTNSLSWYMAPCEYSENGHPYEGDVGPISDPDHPDRRDDMDLTGP